MKDIYWTQQCLQTTVLKYMKKQLAYRQEFHIFWGVKAKEHTIMHIEIDKNPRHLAERN